MKTLNDICPMTLPRLDGPYDCARKKCRWWTTYYKDTDREYQECVMQVFSILLDIQEDGDNNGDKQ